MNKPNVIGASIMLASGEYFDFTRPEQCNITIEDIAYGLASCNRFVGHTVSSITGQRVFYNVAQHSVLMSFYVPAHLRYDALMHEAGEAVCGDISGPLKTLCPDFKRIEKRCEAAIHARFSVEMSEPDTIKHYDRRMLATEKRDLMPASEHDVWSFVAGAEPFPSTIVPWESYTSAERFLERYHELAPDSVRRVAARSS